MGVSSSASAAAGDSSSGCTQGAGCELTLRTDKCTNGAAFWLNVWQGRGDTYQAWGHTNANCSLRIQHRMLNSAETAAGWSGWMYRSPGAGTGTLGSPLTASKRCYTQVQVQRNDGSWYQSVHYNSRYWNDTAFRNRCISG